MSDEVVDPAADRQFSMSVTVPVDWPEEMCKAHLGVKALEDVDLRSYRHVPQVRNSLWTARRAATQVFRDMRTAWKAERRRT